MDYIRKMFNKLCKSKNNPVTVKAKEKNTANINTFKGIVGGTVIAVAACCIISGASASEADNSTQIATGTTEESSSDDGAAPGHYLAVADVDVSWNQPVTISLGYNDEAPSEGVPTEQETAEIIVAETSAAEQVATEFTEQVVAESTEQTVATTASEEETEQPSASAMGNESQKVAESEYVITFSDEDYKVLCTIVEAEAGDQDAKGRILVANVIINRVKSQSFPNTITDVVFQKSGNTYQFSPTKPGGRYYKVTASELTVQCVDRALKGEDYSEGAIYFAMKTSSNSWFNRSLEFLFKHGDHYFYK